MTWVPDKSKYIDDPNVAPNFALGGLNGEGSRDIYVPYVKTLSTNTMEFNGDENVGIYFAKKTAVGSGLNTGIHQGYFELYFDIGNNPVAGSSSNLTTNANYTATTVDASVGVYSESGQRTGIDLTSLNVNAKT